MSGKESVEAVLRFWKIVETPFEELTICTLCGRKVEKLSIYRMDETEKGWRGMCNKCEILVLRNSVIVVKRVIFSAVSNRRTAQEKKRVSL